ncbi:MAG: hypothetical protein IT226_10990 [Flavobacteriales bacterium]|nr:hypothetical protein [Flavobacteriales bacterium]
MSAEEFIEAWKEFLKKYDVVLLKTWTSRDDKAWIRQVIGAAKSSETDSPFGDYLMAEERITRYRTEEWKVDFVASCSENWPDPHGWIKKRKHKFWPRTYDILIEHENYCTTSWEEMAKLILLRAKLKVLITYTEDVGHTDSEKLIKQTREQLESMLEQAWEDHSENEKTEYVLIIGQLDRNGEKARANWHISAYNVKGEQCASTYEDPWSPT